MVNSESSGGRHEHHHVSGQQDVTNMQFDRRAWRVTGHSCESVNRTSSPFGIPNFLVKCKNLGRKLHRAQVSDILMPAKPLTLYTSMSASHEKSPTESTLKHSTPPQQKPPFCSEIGVPVCATLACWQAMSKSRRNWSKKCGPFRWAKSQPYQPF